MNLNCEELNALQLAGKLLSSSKKLDFALQHQTKIVASLQKKLDKINSKSSICNNQKRSIKSKYANAVHADSTKGPRATNRRVKPISILSRKKDKTLLDENNYPDPIKVQPIATINGIPIYMESSHQGKMFSRNCQTKNGSICKINEKEDRNNTIMETPNCTSKNANNLNMHGKV